MSTVTSGDAEVDREEFRKSFEQLLAEVEVADIEQLEPDLQQYPSLVKFYVSNINGFRMLDNWSASKSKMIVSLFLVLMLIGILLRVFGYIK